MPIIHTKVSNIASTGDPSLVQPQDWNAAHTISGTLDLSGATSVIFGLIPNTVLAFSATPSFNVTANASYSMTLTGNVTSSSTIGVPVNGQLLSLTITQDAVGGRSFAFPANFVFPPTFSFDTTALHINELTFKFDGTNWHLISNSGGAGGGANPAGSQGDLQSKNGTNLQASSINDNGSRVNVSNDAHFKGPNPYTDATNFGVRAVSATPSTTATISSGSPNATLAAASTFVNGDGVVVRGAGATFALSTPVAPTVTPSVASFYPGTGVVTTGPTGSTQYVYCVAVRDISGGVSPCSPNTTITTGQASLGPQTVNIQAISRSNNTVTVTTASAHGLAVNALVWIKNSTGLDFDGHYIVATVPDNTHFTYTSGKDTRNGALASGGTSGIITWYNSNHITFAHIANAWQYLVYGGPTSGSMVLLGVSKIDNNFSANNVGTYDNFDDFGATMTSPLLSSDVPGYYSLTPPVSAKNDDLVTTILSGAGTTSVVLANNALQSVSGVAFVFDNTPNIRTAAIASVQSTAGGSVLYFPFASNQFYVTNSVLDLSGGISANGLSVVQGGLFAIGETVIFRNGIWKGLDNPSALPQFGKKSLPGFFASQAYPAFYLPSPTATFENINLTSNQSNQAVLVQEDDAGQIPATRWHSVQFNTSGGSNDYMGMHFLARGNGGTADFEFNNCLFLAGPGVNAVDSTPLLYFDGTTPSGEGGKIIFRDTFMNRRGMLFKGTSLLLTVNNLYEQGGIMPILSVASGGGGNSNIAVDASNVIEDTMIHPIVTVLGGGISGQVTIDGTSGPTGGYPTVVVPGPAVTAFFNDITNSTANLGLNIGQSTGPIQTNAVDGTLNTAAGTVAIETHNALLSVGTPYQLFVNALPQAAPTCAVSAGGTVAVDTYSFIVVPVFPGNGEGKNSPASTTCTTSSGNQTITINWAAVPGAIGYDLYRAGSGSPSSYFGFQCTSPWVNGLATSYVWSGAGICGTSLASQAGSGPVSVSSAGLAAPTLKVTGGNGGGVASITAPTLTANRTVTLPDTSGAVALSTGAMTNPAHLLKTRADGTIQDAGVNSLGVYDGFNRANGAITVGNPNWTVLAGSFNVAGNTTQSASSGQNYAIYNGTTFLGDDQSVSFRGIATGTQSGSGLNGLVRFQNNVTLNGYGCGTPITSGTNFVGSPTVFKWVAGTFSTLTTGTSGTWPSGTTFTCNAVGTTITMYADGVQIVQSTGDASFSSGFPGLAVFNAQTLIAFDDFWASIGAVGLNTAQTWSASQTFSGGITGTGSVGTLTTPLSNLTAATTADTLNSGDNAQTWNWALSTVAKTAFKVSENTAAVNGVGSQFLAQFGTLAGSTAVPLNLFSSLTGSQTLPTLSITPTWNTTGVVDAGLLINPTNTASGAGSLLADFQLTNVSQWKVDKGGTTTQLGTAALGATPPGCTPGSGGGSCLNEGTGPSAGTTYDTLYADSTQQAVSINNHNTGNMAVSRVACVNVTPVTVNTSTTADQNLMSCTLSANLLNVVGRTLKIWTSSLYATPAASVATVTNKIKLCVVSGCGSGNVVTLVSYVSSANPGSVTNNAIGTETFSTTQTAGAASAYETHGNMTIDLGATPGAADATFADTNTTTSATIDSTVQLFLQVTGAFSAASASNTITQRQLIVEVLN